MADVFLSYAREDLPFVRRLTAALQARNREVWVDLEDIIPSARWLEEIRTGITEADAVVFVVSPDSVASEVCRVELDHATETSKRLVPILAREISTGGVPPALADLHWLSFLDGTDFDIAVDRLVEAQLILASRRGATRRQRSFATIVTVVVVLAVVLSANRLVVNPLPVSSVQGIAFGPGIDDLAFSPDGRLLVTAGAHGIRLWDVASRQPVGDDINARSSHSSTWRSALMES